MKATTLCFAFLLSAQLPATTEPVEIGQSLTQTLDALGKPVGTIQLRDKTLLLYPQGEITLRDDHVTDVEWINQEQFAADQERLRIEREQWQYEQTRQSAARIIQGQSIKADKLNNPAFAALPAKERVDFWRRFQINYPELDASSEIAGALESYNSERAELESQQRIAELESRVASAEKEAALARLEAVKARDETRARSRRSLYRINNNCLPYLRSRDNDPPPRVTIFTERTSKHTRATSDDWHDRSARIRQNATARVNRISSRPHRD